MSARIQAILMAGVSALAFAVAPPTIAQQADQPAASSTSGLEEVVVTARRREEKEQTVPLSITAFTAQQITENSIRSYSDLDHFVPSLTVYNGTTRYSQNFISIRGLGAGSTVTYFAEVPSKIVGLGSTFDLESLQVLIGPQGTLFGRSAVGGAFVFEPKRPTNNFEGYAQFTAGSYNDLEFEGALNVPIVDDKVLLRIAGQRQQRDGFTTDVGPINTGKDYDNRDYWSGRIGLTLRPTDDFENYTLITYFYNHDNGLGSHLHIIDPNGVASFGGAKFSQLFPNAYAVLNAEAALGPWKTALDDQFSIDKALNYSLTDIARWDVTDELTVKNIASVTIEKSLTGYDFDGSLLGFSKQGTGAPYTQEPWNSGTDTPTATYTEELQLLGKSFNDRLNWVVGGFMSFEHVIENGQFGQEAVYYPGVAPGATTFTVSSNRNTEKEQAIYGQATYDFGGVAPFLEGLSLTAGYRYSWDYNTSWGQEFGTFGQCVTGFSGKNCGSVSSEYRLSRPTWNVSLDYKVTPEILTYVRSGRGFLGGSLTLSNPVGYQMVQPESLTDVEVGVKADFSLFGIKGRANADIYYDMFSQIQESVGLFIPGRGTIGANINAAEADLKGFELQGTLLPIDSVEITGNYAYEEGAFSKFINPAATPMDQSGIPFRFLPKHKGTLTVRYHLPIDESVGDVSVAVTGTAQTKVHVAPDIEPNDFIVGYGLLNFNADWNNIFGSTFDADFFMTNATDTVYRIANASAYFQVGFVPVSYGEPRMFGFRLKYRFGPDGSHEAAVSTAAYVPPAAQPVQPAAPKSYLVFFDFDKSDLTSAGRQIVDQAAMNAPAAKVTQIAVTGHTDTVGSDEYNMRLSKRRAMSVAAELEAHGIPESEIAIVAKGKRDPLVPTGDGVREPQNRRVEIVYGGGAGS